MADLTANLDTLKKAADNLQAEIDAINASIAKHFSDRTDYLRQWNLKQNENDIEAVKWARGKVAEEDAIIDGLTAQLKAKQAQFDAANKAYKDALSNLTPEQKDQLASEQKIATLQAAAQTLKAGTTKYLIYGALALVAVVIVVVFIRKRYN